MKLDMISECTGAEILRVQLSGKDISNILDGGKVVWALTLTSKVYTGYSIAWRSWKKKVYGKPQSMPNRR